MRLLPVAVEVLCLLRFQRQEGHGVLQHTIRLPRVAGFERAGDHGLARIDQALRPHVVDEQDRVGAVAVAVEIALAGPARLLAAAERHETVAEHIVRRRQRVPVVVVHGQQGAMVRVVQLQHPVERLAIAGQLNAGDFDHIEVGDLGRRERHE